MHPRKAGLRLGGALVETTPSRASRSGEPGSVLGTYDVREIAVEPLAETPTAPLTVGPALIVILLLSLGLWALIWAAVRLACGALSSTPNLFAVGLPSVAHAALEFRTR
jgi:hypothetical protein